MAYPLEVPDPLAGGGVQRQQAVGEEVVAEAVGAGAEFATTCVDGLERRDDRWCIVSGNDRLLARSLILATGSTLKELGVPGETRLRGKGVSQCASCDAPLVRNRPVAVVGENYEFVSPIP